MSVNTLSTKRGTYLGSASGQIRGLVSQSVAASATQTFDVDVSDYDNFTVLVSMTGAANTDLVVTVEPFEEDGVTVFGIGLTEAVKSGPTFVTPNVYYAGQFDTRGLQKVRVSVKNANAASQTINFVDVLAGLTGCEY